jgi:endoglucanase Acf2
MKYITPILSCVLAVAVSAEFVKVGAGGYRNDLPLGEDGKPRRQLTESPLVAPGMQAPIPTNDWWSSLIWPLHSPHSQAMFPHPLAVKAQEHGLGIGYTQTPIISDHNKDGKVFQKGTGYRYPYCESIVVGLAGMEVEETVVDSYSDWAVTARWQDGADELLATIAHGSPFVFFETESGQPMQLRFSAAKVDRNREPVRPITHTWSGITSVHSGKPGGIDLAINAGRNVGIGSKARLVYDFDGDGETDRVETFQLFATDPVAGSWERYSSSKQTLDPGLTRGKGKHFKNGSIRLEFWKCFGKGSVYLKLADCRVVLPIKDGERSLKADAEFATVGTDDKPLGAAKVTYRKGSTLGVKLNGSDFAIFAARGVEWGVVAGDRVDSLRAGSKFLVVAAMPDGKAETIEWFGRYAYSVPRDTRVRYRYDAKSGKVETTFSAFTEALEGVDQGTVFALYRHQHLNVTEPYRLTAYRYASPRGEMRVMSGREFSTAIAFLGVLPALPNAAADSATLAASLDADLARIRSRKTPFERTDTYWNGKELGKFCELIQIAEQSGKAAMRDELLGLLKARMEDWFDGKEPLFFYYDGRWDTLTGYPDSYGSGEQLNDHHFHYSYFIKAAATIAQYDADWVKPERYGGMIEALIRDCANAERKDTRFPWMRSFDPYAGHSWAAGHAGFASGNNQESSSESMNFATALVLYGTATGRDDLRDLGIYWHSTEAEAIRHYWFDLDGAVFPEGYAHSCVGMVWGDGGSYGTWWTANPEEIHGINYLPLNGGSLYLGRSPEYVRKNLIDLRSSNTNFHNAGFPGPADSLDRWQDIIYEYQALADPEQAATRFRSLGATHESEFGETRTHTLQWLGALGELGQVDASVLANHPTAVAFKKAGKARYVVYNAGASPLSVRFSDGKRVRAEPGLSLHKN